VFEKRDGQPIRIGQKINALRGLLQSGLAWVASREEPLDARGKHVRAGSVEDIDGDGDERPAP
jgi:hypothetical protein